MITGRKADWQNDRCRRLRGRPVWQIAEDPIPVRDRGPFDRADNAKPPGRNFCNSDRAVESQDARPEKWSRRESNPRP